jgi:hypothetical protein
MNQKGFAPIVIILVVIAAVIVGAGAFLYTSRDDSEDATLSDTPTATETETHDEAGSFSGSYFSAIEKGEALECTWRVPEELASEFQVGEGQFYTDGKSRGRAEASFKNNDAVFTTHSVFNQDAIYNWTELPESGPTVGFKISQESLKQMDSELSAEERQQAEQIRAEYQFDCEPWNVDEAKFKLPAGVSFTEISS